MNPVLSELWLHEQVCSLIDVTRTNQGFEIELPQVYFDGRAVAVVVAPHGGGYTIHDNSYAAMAMAAVGVRASGKTLERLTAAVNAYGCKLEGFRVQRWVEGSEEIGVAAVTVGAASRLVADEGLRGESAPLYDFKRSVVSRIAETIGITRMRENEEFVGASGSPYRVSAVILDQKLERPTAFIEPVSEHASVARRFREFFDLRENIIFGNIERIAVYDDSRPDVTSGDVLLLQNVANPVRARDIPARFRAYAQA